MIWPRSPAAFGLALLDGSACHGRMRAFDARPRPGEPAGEEETAGITRSERFWKWWRSQFPKRAFPVPQMTWGKFQGKVRKLTDQVQARLGRRQTMKR